MFSTVAQRDGFFCQGPDSNLDRAEMKCWPKDQNVNDNEKDRCAHGRIILTAENFSLGIKRKPSRPKEKVAPRQTRQRASRWPKGRVYPWGRRQRVSDPGFRVLPSAWPSVVWVAWQPPSERALGGAETHGAQNRIAVAGRAPGYHPYGA